MTRNRSETEYLRFLDRLNDDVECRRARTAEDYALEFPDCADEIREDYGDLLPLWDPNEELQPPIGPYEWLGPLARGGMGRLSLAWHPQLQRRVVLKSVLRSTHSPPDRAGDRTTRRLEREAAALGRVDDDGICSILDVLVHEETTYLVLPYLDGEDLESALQRARQTLRNTGSYAQAWASLAQLNRSTGPSATRSTNLAPFTSPRPSGSAVDLRSVLWWMEQIARSLHVAHEAGVIHRDLKPSNVMIRSDLRPVIVDFGLALVESEAEQTRLTRCDERPGTLAYMAPELLADSSGPADRRSDVYALGVILYELLVLDHAFGEARADVLDRRIREARWSPLRRRNPAIPRDLEAVCSKAIEQDPASRYSTALELAEDLARVRRLEPTQARPVGSVGRWLRRARRHPRVVSGFGLAAILLIVASFALALQRQRLEQVQAQSASLKGRLQDSEARLEHALALILARYSDSAPEPGSAPIEIEGLQRELGLSPAAAEILGFAPRSLVDFDALLALPGRSSSRGGSDTARVLEPNSAVRTQHPLLRFERLDPDIQAVLPSLRRNGEMADIPLLPARASEFGGFETRALRPLDAAEYVFALNWEQRGKSRTLTRYFRVVDDAEVRRALARLRPTDDALFDALARAATLLSFDLAEEAMAELTVKTAEHEDARTLLRSVLRARAAAILGEDRDIEVEKLEYFDRLEALFEQD